MNEMFRKKKGPTDVLSFPATARRRGLKTARPAHTWATSPSLRDGVAAMPRKTAERSSELQVLILHGLLHLRATITKPIAAKWTALNGSCENGSGLRDESKLALCSERRGW